MIFRVGDLIEVIDRKKRYKDSYFEGKVLEVFELGYRVRYDLLIDKKVHQPVEELVEFKKCRPRPPPIKFIEYYDGDIVDVFFDNGWWKGVVSDIVFGDVIVFFEKNNMSKEFKLKDIRLHQEWDAEDSSWEYYKIHL